jgi:hypothetical protein
MMGITIKDSDSGATHVKAADDKLEELKELASSEGRRWFNVGPKRKLGQMDLLRKKILEQNEQNLRTKGMQKLRVEKGLTRMQGRKEIKNR